MDIKDFVSFETAKKLKSLGFDEPCRYFYENANCTDIRYTLYRYYNDKEPFCSAPMLWQAQKWLREKHRIHIRINFDSDRDWNKSLLLMDEDRDIVCITAYYSSYERALQDAIDESLNYIIKQNRHEEDKFLK